MFKPVTNIGLHSCTQKHTEQSDESTGNEVGGAQSGQRKRLCMRGAANAGADTEALTRASRSMHMCLHQHISTPHILMCTTSR